jgi:hypothetical protein
MRTKSVPASTTTPTLQQSMLARDHIDPAVDGMRVHIVATGRVPSRLAEVELHFTAGPLAGLKLIGFGIWHRANRPITFANLSVTYPARTYSANGERRSFALLRPLSDSTNRDQLAARIINTYLEGRRDGEDSSEETQQQ